MDKFLYLSDYELCSGEKDAPASKATSGYINKYNETVLQSIARDNWKNSGASAQFQQRTPSAPAITDAQTTGICPFSEDEFLYTAQVNDVSAIIKKDYKTETEQYVIHSNNQIFKGVDCKEGLILTCASNDRQTSHVATFNTVNGDLNVLTSGDAVEENAAFSHKDGSIIFNSKGVGRNQYLEKVGESNSTLYRISSGYFSSCDEILAEDGFDLIAPQEDSSGNLYYIRKPYKQRQNRDVGVADILLLPFRLLFNLFRLMFFLSKIGSKSNKKKSELSSGDNPYKTPAQSERDIYVLSEKINIEKEEKNNAKKGEKNPGFAPHSFELIKHSTDGVKTRLKSGVLGYDLSNDDKIIFTNGRYIIRLDENGETVLHRDKFIKGVKAR